MYITLQPNIGSSVHLTFPCIVMIAFESYGSSSVPISSFPPSTISIYSVFNSISGFSLSNIRVPPLINKNLRVGVDSSRRMVCPLVMTMYSSSRCSSTSPSPNGRPSVNVVECCCCFIRIVCITSSWHINNNW